VNAPLNIVDPDSIEDENEENILKICHIYFANYSENMQKMADIVEGRSDITLRILDWFVNVYAYENNLLDIYENYRSTLESRGKQYFDPFRRKFRFDHKYVVNGREKYLSTSIGQLNFFKWAFEHHIIDTVEHHLPQIKIDMQMREQTTYR